MQPQQHVRGRYLQGLDGLRAVAVIAVVLYHVAPHVLPGGFVGVDIFFVISGLLITTLLIEERNSYGHIRLKNFWSRRARRLLPALLATICVIASTSYFAGGDILVGIGRQILGALTFSNNWVEIAAGSNYFDASTPHLFTNLWSLAVEEQFYVVWPFIVAALVSVPAFARRARLGVWVCLLLAIGSSWCMAFMYNGNNATRVYYGTDTHVFGLMIGSMMAFWARAKTIQSLNQPEKPHRTVKRFGWLALFGLLALMCTLGNQVAFTYQGGLQLASISAAVLVVSVITTRGLLHKIFTFKTLEWIGLRSYGIYLWHWPVLVLLRQTLGQGASIWEIGLLTAGITICVAALSYHYLETPIRQMGVRAYILRGIRHEVAAIDGAVAQWKLRPHPVMLASCIVIALTAAAVLTAPTKTTAQLRIEAGERAIGQAKMLAGRQSQAARNHAQNNTAGAGQAQQAAPGQDALPDGSDITVVGDSVTLASADALQQRFPGIYIDAAVSRSMRQGGLDTIDALLQNNQMRGTVVVALGTNGYYGAGNLEKVIAELGNRRIIFVTSHAPDDWAAGNNDNLRKTAMQYANVHLAEWDAAITPHADELADGIHPGSDGATIYADCIAGALAQFTPPKSKL
ncbi:MAG TPA: acyltransferase family protein [Candidatus Saccharimonadales bacterium]|nr:acyltransferase family protein [Candidatus Saccharimonadales bacterium]